MKYTSTRSKTTSVSFEEALTSGYAPDGGLFVPECPPFKFHPYVLSLWSRLDFPHLMYSVLRLFIEDREIPDSELHALVMGAFQDWGDGEKEQKLYPHRHIPLDLIGSPETPAQSIHVAELFHGPTFCFKDIGLRVVVGLLGYFAQQRQKPLTVLLSTTGDTGPAAVRAVADLNHNLLSAVVHYPKDQISDFQKRQLLACKSKHVKIVEFEGGGDDMDEVIKKILHRQQSNNKYNQATGSTNLLLTGVNSYNIGRPLVQMVHYIWTYFRVLEKVGLELPGARELSPVDFILPTGAMGNLAAGYMVKNLLGFPVGFLCCGVNVNDVTHRIFETGQVQATPGKMLKTYSQALNVQQVPYNFERILYYMTAGNQEFVQQSMSQLAQTGQWDMGQNGLARLRYDLRSARITDEEMCETMRWCYANFHKVVDPHTAVALCTALKLGYPHRGAGPGRLCALLATASPCKFQEAIVAALGQPVWEQLAPTFATAAKDLEHLPDESLATPVEYDMVPSGSYQETQAAWEEATCQIITQLTGQLVPVALAAPRRQDPVPSFLDDFDYGYPGPTAAFSAISEPSDAAFDLTDPMSEALDIPQPMSEIETFSARARAAQPSVDFGDPTNNPEVQAFSARARAAQHSVDFGDPTNRFAAVQDASQSSHEEHEDYVAELTATSPPKDLSRDEYPLDSSAEGEQNTPEQKPPPKPKTPFASLLKLSISTNDDKALPAPRNLDVSPVAAKHTEPSPLNSTSTHSAPLVRAMSPRSGALSPGATSLPGRGGRDLPAPDEFPPPSAFPNSSYSVPPPRSSPMSLPGPGDFSARDELPPPSAFPSSMSTHSAPMRAPSPRGGALSHMSLPGPGDLPAPDELPPPSAFPTYVSTYPPRSSPISMPAPGDFSAPKELPPPSAFPSSVSAYSATMRAASPRGGALSPMSLPGPGDLPAPDELPPPSGFPNSISTYSAPPRASPISMPAPGDFSALDELAPPSAAYPSSISSKTAPPPRASPKSLPAPGDFSALDELPPPSAAYPSFMSTHAAPPPPRASPKSLPAPGDFSAPDEMPAAYPSSMSTHAAPPPRASPKSLPAPGDHSALDELPPPSAFPSSMSSKSASMPAHGDLSSPKELPPPSAFPSSMSTQSAPMREPSPRTGAFSPMCMPGQGDLLGAIEMPPPSAFPTSMSAQSAPMTAFDDLPAPDELPSPSAFGSGMSTHSVPMRAPSPRAGALSPSIMSLRGPGDPPAPDEYVGMSVSAPSPAQAAYMPPPEASWGMSAPLQSAMPEPSSMPAPDSFALYGVETTAPKQDKRIEPNVAELRKSPMAEQPKASAMSSASKSFGMISRPLAQDDDDDDPFAGLPTGNDLPPPSWSSAMAPAPVTDLPPPSWSSGVAPAPASQDFYLPESVDRPNSFGGMAPYSQTAPAPSPAAAAFATPPQDKTKPKPSSNFASLLKIALPEKDRKQDHDPTASISEATSPTTYSTGAVPTNVETVMSLELGTAPEDPVIQTEDSPHI